MTIEQPTAANDEIVGSIAVDARRIGLIGDDHNAEEDGSDLPVEVLEAFRDVDLILHLGHMGQREVFARGALDRLETVAPVLGVQDYSVGKDGAQLISPPDGNRIAGMTRVVEAAGVRIGLVHNLCKSPGPEIPAAPGGLPEIDGDALSTTLAQKFGGPVDVVAFAGTHRAATVTAGGVLFVNPGSPTYPKGPGRVPGERSHGTVGILELSHGAIAYETVDLHCLAVG
ncbi:metallophosphoesterase family protein [Kribbella shirazensis]|uniref:Calcineurin-like phosphoesterase domain-containing protein n=1 Tax=Kribbella shirazensis TaxID=1105143 RepID=A0A7X6A4G9_9ACTN|nr:metallophosphoesterase family protein [Kribbella shirazensis]NIK61446.1 hypothetical protein [Kribbella shirazensis]